MSKTQIKAVSPERTQISRKIGRIELSESIFEQKVLLAQKKIELELIKDRIALLKEERRNITN